MARFAVIALFSRQLLKRLAHCCIAKIDHYAFARLGIFQLHNADCRQVVLPRIFQRYRYQIVTPIGNAQCFLIVRSKKI
jgi:hypothetical protein